MSTENKDLTPEEEKVAQAAPKEEEIRANIIDEYGFNETDDAEKIDKLVTKEVDHATKLSSAIGQKIKHRDKVTELEGKLEEKKPLEEEKKEIKTDTSEDLDKSIDAKLDARLQKKELEDLGYPEDLTKEIKDLAALKNISVKEILKDPYIVSRIGEHNEENESEEASISNKHIKRGTKKNTLDNPPDVNMNTEEGRKKYDDWKQDMIKQGH